MLKIWTANYWLNNKWDYLFFLFVISLLWNNHSNMNAQRLACHRSQFHEFFKLMRFTNVSQTMSLWINKSTWGLVHNFCLKFVWDPPVFSKCNPDGLLLKRADRCKWRQRRRMKWTSAFFSSLPEILKEPKITLKLTNLVSTCVRCRKFSFFFFFCLCSLSYAPLACILNTKLSQKNR